MNAGAYSGDWAGVIARALVVDSAGVVYICVAAGSPGTWQRLTPTTSVNASGDLSLAGGVLADNAVTQAKLADMALAVDASALLIYRAAWEQDEGGIDVRRAAAMAKLHATEAAQWVIDDAVQMHGGAGVTRGVKVEELYRDIRALRIYEGASEVQRQIIARDLLKGVRP